MPRKEIYLQDKIIGRHYSTKNFRVMERNKVFERSNSKEIINFEQRISKLNCERERIAAARNKLIQNREVFNSTGKMIEQMHKSIDESFPDKRTETVKQACNDSLLVRRRGYTGKCLIGSDGPRVEMSEEKRTIRWPIRNALPMHGIDMISTQTEALLSPRMTKSLKIRPDTAINARPKTGKSRALRRGSCADELLMNVSSRNKDNLFPVKRPPALTKAKKRQSEENRGSLFHGFSATDKEKERKKVHFADERHRKKHEEDVDPLKMQVIPENQEGVDGTESNDINGNECEEQEGNKQEGDEDELKNKVEVPLVLPKLAGQQLSSKRSETEEIILPKIVERRRQSLLNITEIQEMVRMRKANSVDF